MGQNSVRSYIERDAVIPLYTVFNMGANAKYQGDLFHLPYVIQRETGILFSEDITWLVVCSLNAKSKCQVDWLHLTIFF